MDWWHETSIGWMLERRNVLTASEIKSLIPAWKKATKAQKAGEVILPAFASLWLEKQSHKPLETFSRGVMARGHILEPYAISDWNDNLPQYKGSMFMYHWDDVIIVNGGIGWSPDGMSIPQESPGPKITIDNNKFVSNGIEFQACLPHSFIEVKSYEASNHMKKILSDKMSLDERWQMAVAFYTVPSLKEGVLLFYSIDTDYTRAFTYTREELKDEIELIESMVLAWTSNCAMLKALPIEFNRSWTEVEVHDKWSEENTSVISW